MKKIVISIDVIFKEGEMSYLIDKPRSTQIEVEASSIGHV